MLLFFLLGGTAQLINHHYNPYVISFPMIYNVTGLPGHMARDKNLDLGETPNVWESPLFLSKNVTSRQGKPPELAGNSKLAIERISLGGMLNLAEDNDWPPRGLKVPHRGFLPSGRYRQCIREE